ncbi:nucleotidyltransferase domain-containing protein [Candidatus Woesearchaeota archaeon]|nr:nucleotidyltransferase domain-containing protein [Candidatus Woesearchaeota archaeon]
MMTILKSGYYRIMQLFHKDKTAKLHLREIARQAKLHGPSATKCLKELEKANILMAEKDANLKKYSVKKNKQAYIIFEMFDVEKLEKLPIIRQNAVDHYLDSLPEKPIFVILFGSTAKETYGKESDIDILLVTNKKINAENAEKEADAQTAIKISTFQITYKDFIEELKLRKDRVVQSAINTGYPIINHSEYYKVFYNERV